MSPSFLRQVDVYIEQVNRTIVIGGGVIGLWCAYELSRRGRQVTIIDRNEPGGACSKGNTGWIVPSFSAPLPAPGLAWTSIKWMRSADSPLYIRPRALPSLAGWLWSFWRHCNWPDHRAGLEAVARLNADTMKLFDAAEDAGLEFEMQRAGLLCVFREEAALARTLDTLDRVAAFGLISPQRLTAEQTREMEPSLAGSVAGGIWIPEERHLRPESLNAALARRLVANGVDLRPGCEATGAMIENGNVRAISVAPTIPAADSGTLEGDEFVITAGAWSASLARSFGFRLPLQAGKGYSITIERSAVKLKQPLYFPESKVVCSPFEGALRVGGTMELSGIDAELDRRRILAIRRVAGTHLPGYDSGEIQAEWAGLRPLTPDGLPVIGQVPRFENLWIASGHAMLGMTLAPSTAVLMADLICAGRSGARLAPFAPERFTS